MEGRFSTAAGARSICLGLFAVSHACGLPDWLDRWTQDARLLASHYVAGDAAESDGCSLHALVAGLMAVSIISCSLSLTLSLYTDRRQSAPIRQ